MTAEISLYYRPLSRVLSEAAEVKFKFWIFNGYTDFVQRVRESNIRVIVISHHPILSICLTAWAWWEISSKFHGFFTSFSDTLQIRISSLNIWSLRKFRWKFVEVSLKFRRELVSTNLHPLKHPKSTWRKMTSEEFSRKYTLSRLTTRVYWYVTRIFSEISETWRSQNEVKARVNEWDSTQRLGDIFVRMVSCSSTFCTENSRKILRKSRKFSAVSFCRDIFWINSCDHFFTIFRRTFVMI